MTDPSEAAPPLRPRAAAVAWGTVWRQGGWLGILRLCWSLMFSTRGLVISVGVHLGLLSLAFVWGVSVMEEQRAKPSEVFVIRGGGGVGGERARVMEHNLKQQKAKSTARSVARIASNNPDAKIAVAPSRVMAMPSPLNLSQADSLSAKMAGGSSAGFGGGSGGGIGGGKGLGVGKPRSFIGKPVMGAKIAATKIAVFLDASRSMGRYLDRVEGEIRQQFPDADVFLYAGIWTNVKDDVIIGGSKYKGTTGRSGAPPVRTTEPAKLTPTGKRIFKEYDDNFTTGCLGAWIDIMRRERYYDGLVIFSDFQDGVTQYRSLKGPNPDSYSTRDTTIIYSDGMRSKLPTDDRKPGEKRWEEELIGGFAAAKSGQGPKLYLFSTQVEPQSVFSRCVIASGGQAKMVEWLRTGGNPPPE